MNREEATTVERLAATPNRNCQADSTAPDYAPAPGANWQGLTMLTMRTMPTMPTKHMHNTARLVLVAACLACNSCGSDGTPDLTGGTPDADSGTDASDSGRDGTAGEGGTGGAGGTGGTGETGETGGTGGSGGFQESCQPSETECGANCCDTATQICDEDTCVEKCQEGTTCDTGKVCDASNACVDGCFIGGLFYDHGDEAPSNECQVCSSADTSDWTPVQPGSPCDHDGGTVCDFHGECVNSTMISTGGDHTCGVTSAGMALCWGSNESQQLGDGTSESRSVPTSVLQLGSGVILVSAGGDTNPPASGHTCALTSAGAVMCWGSGTDGTIGDGTNGIDRATPTQVQGLESGVVTISAGSHHTCALTKEGAVKCWGANDMGQLGDNSQEARSVPTQVVGLETGAIAVSAGGKHTCAVTAAGGVQCWGLNAYGQLGNGTTDHAHVPTPVSSLSTGVVEVSAGGLHSCAILSGGSAMCWGYNDRGQVGSGTAATPQRVPILVSDLTSGVSAISAGHNHTCAIVSGEVLCWGAGSAGKLGGDETPTDRLSPRSVSGLGDGVTAISAGGNHTCALGSEARAWCWGNNTSGQLGDNSGSTQWSPSLVVGFP